MRSIYENASVLSCFNWGFGDCAIPHAFGACQGPNGGCLRAIEGREGLGKVDDAGCGAGSVARGGRQAVDEYVETQEDALARPEQLELGLTELLSGHKFWHEFARGPYVRRVETIHGPALIIGYILSRGAGTEISSSVVFSAYGVVGGKLSRVADSGEDFKGYGFFAERLSAPDPLVPWFLVWGARGQSNGPGKARLRTYAFDGEMFRTVWTAEDVIEAAVHVTPAGFSVEQFQPRVGERRGYTKRVDYVLMSDGPRAAASYAVSAGAPLGQPAK
jgi:hypothetical protein